MNSISYRTERRQGGVWSILNRFLIGAIIVLLTVAAAATFIPLLHKRDEEQARLTVLREQAAKEKALLARRTREVEWLRTNPEYVETRARDTLDLMKPGETILRFDDAAEEAPIATP